jgi:hypothetical protein
MGMKCSGDVGLGGWAAEAAERRSIVAAPATSRAIEGEGETGKY